MKKFNILWIIKMIMKKHFFLLSLNIIILCIIPAIFFSRVSILEKIIFDVSNNLGNLFLIRNQFILFIIIYFATFLFYDLFAFIQTIAMTSFVLKVNSLLQYAFLEKTMLIKQESFLDHKFMDNFNLINKSISKVGNFIYKLLDLFFNNFILILICLIMILKINFLIFIYLIVMLIIQILISVKQDKKYNEFYKKNNNNKRKSDYYTDVLRDKKYAKEVRLFGLKEMFLQKWKTEYELYSVGEEKISTEYEIKQDLFNTILFIFETIAFIILLFSVSKDTLKLTSFVVLINLWTGLFLNVKNSVRTITRTLAGKMIFLIKYREFILDESNTIKLANPFDFTRLKLNKVCYKYPNTQQNALTNINLEINKGETIALLGFNGSGKSTLSKIISGLLTPSLGEIVMNDTLVVKDERPFFLFGLAYQDFIKYSLSIKENILISNLEGNNLLESTYSRLGIQGIIDKSPDGENTILTKTFDKDGSELSGGEWQKIALARLYVSSAPIYILDEPTAAIDPLEEYRLLDNFKNIIQGKTTILISHRIGFARLAEKIVVINDGQIVEVGSHDELVKKKGFYWEMYHIQKELYEENVYD